jgi:hypothetical protein
MRVHAAAKSDRRNAETSIKSAWVRPSVSSRRFRAHGFWLRALASGQSYAAALATTLFRMRCVSARTQPFLLTASPSPSRDCIGSAYRAKLDARATARMQAHCRGCEQRSRACSVFQLSITTPLSLSSLRLLAPHESARAVLDTIAPPHPGGF